MAATFDGGDGQRDSDAMVMAMEGGTVMRWQRRAIEDAREIRWQWKVQQSNGGGSDSRHNDCNGCQRIHNNHATVTALTAMVGAMERRRWTAMWQWT
jgi:hypothetical protein